MQKDQLIKKLNEAKEHLFTARLEFYEAIKVIENLEKKVIKDDAK